MNRRDTLIAMLALGAVPLAAEAQRPAKPRRIAWLGMGSPETSGHFVDVVKRALRESGFVEGKDFVFEFRWAFGKADLLPGLARELVALQPDVILSASASGTTMAAQQATSTIPIVFQGVGDPVGAGFVKSLARPGGNLTGLTNLTVDLSPKLLQLLLTIAPKLSRVAVLVNPSIPIQTAMVKNLQSASQKLSVSILPIEARDPTGIEDGFGRMRQERAEAVVVLGDVIFWFQREQIAELASRNRMPSMFAIREHVESGGLMSYGQNSIEPFRRAATYVAKILNGAKPADLPVEQSTKFELVINLKTAKALGLVVPTELLLRADEVIQ